MTRRPDALTAVVDIGKTRTKLLLIDEAGTPVHATQQPSRSVESPLGYLALDSEAVAAWLADALAGLGPLRRRLARIVPTTHGAAFAALRGEGLAFAPPDYEFTGFEPATVEADGGPDPFDETWSPSLPQGLNLGTQLDWLERHHPATLAQAKVLLPYAQYWAWWLSGVAASEVSSLGCHTHLWRPAANDYSHWARRRGWAARFAPLRRAWEVLGPIRPALADRLGLPHDLQVCTGAHDSNACLARYLRAWPRMTLVSTGTWTVVMAPGAPARELDPARDLLGNVSVRGERVPTGRFMGGREIETLCAGADPGEASIEGLARLLALRPGLTLLPAFATQGGPFARRTGTISDAGEPLSPDAFAQRIAPAERATLAALYAADVTAWLLERLGAAGPVVLEGPLAHNPVFAVALAALRPAGTVHASTDPVEGTARGGWCLARWTEPQVLAPRVAEIAPGPLAPDLCAHHARWLAML